MTELSFLEKLVIGGMHVVTWLGGELGRVVLAGASGGLVRWTLQERRRLRDGVIAVMVGIPTAIYLGPIVPSVLQAAGLMVKNEPEIAPTFGFLAGLLGMSLAKGLLAMIERRMDPNEGDK